MGGRAPRLKVLNETDWNSADLRRLIMFAMRSMGIRKDRHVTVTYGTRGRRQHQIGGFAALSGYTSTMLIPKAFMGRDLAPAEVQQFAQVMVHEFQHNAGAMHKDMPKWWRLEVAWSAGKVIRWKEPKQRQQKVAASPAALIEKRAAHTRTMLKRAKTRVKRAETLLKKWEKRMRYYTRKEGAK